MRQALRRTFRQWLGVPVNRFGISFGLAKHLPRNQPVTLVDVGAHKGAFTESIIRFCGIRQVLMVEPHPTHAGTLRKKFASDKIQIAECALSDKPGTFDLAIPKWTASTSLLTPYKKDTPYNMDSDTTVKVALKTLDQLTEETRITDIDLLKLDVEGVENRVIKGGSKTLARTRMIWTEASFRPLYEGSCLFTDVYTLLQEAGFGLYEIDPGFRNQHDELIQVDALFIKR